MEESSGLIPCILSHASSASDKLEAFLNNGRELNTLSRLIKSRYRVYICPGAIRRLIQELQKLLEASPQNNSDESNNRKQPKDGEEGSRNKGRDKKRRDKFKKLKTRCKRRSIRLRHHFRLL